MAPELLFVLGIGAATLGILLVREWRRPRAFALLRQLADDHTVISEGLPPPPFDRLNDDPIDGAVAQARRQMPDGEYVLWIEEDTWGQGPCVVVLTTHPHPQNYRDTVVLLSTSWEPSQNPRIIRQATDFVRRLYLEGRDLAAGQVWQGFQVLSTLPASIEARLPDDLPRTGADPAYEHLTRILLLYRFSIFYFTPTRQPEQLQQYLTLAAGLAPILNACLGPPPSPFGRDSESPSAH